MVKLSRCAAGGMRRSIRRESGGWRWLHGPKATTVGPHEQLQMPAASNSPDHQHPSGTAPPRSTALHPSLRLDATVRRVARGAARLAPHPAYHRRRGRLGGDPADAGPARVKRAGASESTTTGPCGFSTSTSVPTRPHWARTRSATTSCTSKPARPGSPA